MYVFVHGVRVGVATNSSSSHSIVILKEGRDDVEDSQPPSDQNYGWKYFTLASPESKLGYLAHNIVHSIGNYYDSYLVAKKVEKDINDVLNAGDDEELVQIEVDPEGAVDHQSVINIAPPSGRHPEILSDIVKFFMDPRVIILGGNDNDDMSHPLSGSGVDDGSEVLDKLWGLSSASIRRDKRDEYWSFMYKGNDYRRPCVVHMRIAVDPGPAIVRSEFPELVDLSVGNACTTGCRYCYRGSTPEGGWAKAEDVIRIANNLFEGGTFEVALGGGDPMQHPDIDKIVTNISMYDQTRNLYVTTRETAFLKDAKRVEVLSKHVRAWGFSVDTAKGAERAQKLFQQAGISGDRLNFQVVVGVVGEAEIRKILSQAKMGNNTVTLLGHKTTGFGHKAKIHDVSPEVLKEYVGRISIDTVLARKWNEWLKANAWKGSYETQEGRFSAFIDAQTKMLYRSSFEGDGGKAYPVYEERQYRSSYDQIVSKATIGNAFLKMQEDALGAS